MDEEQRKKRQLGGLKRWAGTDSVTRSQIMSAVRKGVKKGNAESYQQVVNKG